ncbi:MAG TPA: hypothetical protein VFH03_17070 [Actinoplanes sp.]|nr:hypothetical protein [Actinoplanes sp.]
MHQHRRRSRAVWLAGAAAVLVIGGVAAAVGAARLPDGEPEPPVAAVDPPPPRRPDQLTIDINPVLGFVTTVRGTDATRQFVSTRDVSPGTGAGGRYAGEVSAYEPGSFDAAPLRDGEVVDVSGHDARYVPEYGFAALSPDDAPHSSPAVGWADPSGVWLLVYVAPGERATRDDLIRLAESVTLAPPREVRLPFRLGALPDRLAVTYVRANEQADGRGGMVALSDPRRKASSAAVYNGAPYGATVSIFAETPDAEWAAEKRTLTGRRTVAGHPAWYAEGRNMLSPEGNGSALTVDTGRCVIRLRTADRTAISRAELDRTLAEMTIGDCGDPNTWITPLP